MLKGLQKGAAVIDLKVRSMLNRFVEEERGGTEIIAILLIIIILVGVVILFRGQLQTLIENLFTKISNDVNTQL